MTGDRTTGPITPIRTRGAIRTPEGGASSETEKQSIRTRGAIRIRGAGAAHAIEPKIIPLENLLENLREQVGHLPLTVVAHRWGSVPTKAFVEQLETLLHHDDAVWLLPSEQVSSPLTPTSIENVVLLDPQRETDRRIYCNLVGDMIFFPALDQNETAQVAEWTQRTRVLVVDRRGPLAAATLGAGRNASVTTYAWEKGGDLEEWHNAG